MKKNELQIELKYSYRNSDEKLYQEFIKELDNNFIGEKKPYGMQWGAIDLVTCFEIMVTFTIGFAAKPIVQKYFEGLLKIDDFKKLGDAHRQEIEKAFSKMQYDLKILSSFILQKIKNGIPILKFNTNEEAIVLTFPFRNTKFYVVLNHSKMDEELLFNLPQDIIRTFRYLNENNLPNNINALQLYFNSNTKRWKYLFIPTEKGFGNYIDRYVDLDSQKIIDVGSLNEFKKIFYPSEKDLLKLLVTHDRSKT